MEVPQLTRAAQTRTRLTFLVLDLSLDILDSVAGLNLEGDGLPRQRLHEDLHVCRLQEETSDVSSEEKLTG